MFKNAAPVLALLVSRALLAQVDVLTAQYNNGRTSANLQEPILNPSNVAAQQFGRLFSLPVDGPIYSQPLIVTQFSLPGVGSRDLVIVTTLANSVYAFDADNPAQSQPYWHVSLGAPCPVEPQGPSHGVLSTPVIDRSTNTIYLTAAVDSQGDVGLYIFALDLATGNRKFNSPQRAALPLSTGGLATDASYWYQRSGLLLNKGSLFVGYVYTTANFTEEHGFVQAFAADNLSLLASWESSPNTPHGGVWQAARGLAADASGNVFLATADGEWNGTTDFGNSVVELDPGTLAVKNSFAPLDWYSLFIGDLDLGAGGVTLIPNSGLAFAGGKDGVVYLLSTANLGGIENAPAGIPLQKIQASNGCGLTQCGQTLATAFWPDPTTPSLFVWDKQDYLRAYPFNALSQQFNTAAATVGPVLSAGNGGIVVTSNGSTPGTGLVWAATSAQDPLLTVVPGTLRAYSAADITRELYNSDQSFGRDTAGSFVKFLSPVVANGRVYMGNQSGALEVYGLLCQTSQPSNVAVARGPFRTAPGSTQFTQQITFTNRGSGSIGGPFSVAFEGLPAGVTVVNPAGVTSCAAPAGNPFIEAPSAPLWLQSGQSFSVGVTFNRTGAAGVAYTPLLLSGSGGQ